MPWIVLLVLLLVLAGPTALLLMFVMRKDIERLNARIREQDGRLSKLERLLERGPGGAGAEMPAPVAQPPGTSAQTAEPAPPPPASPGPRHAAPTTGLDLEALVGGQWLTWIGVLAIFFGTAFFLGYDLKESAFAGLGQVLTGIVVGILIAAGRWLATRAQRFLGQGLLGGGVALLYLAAYAAYGFHHLVAAPVVYPCLLVVAVVGAWVALRQDSLMVATLTLAGALVTPSVVTAREDTLRLLFPYLLVVNLGSVVLSFRQRWPVLALIAFVGSAGLVTNWWDQFYSTSQRAFTLAGTASLWLVYFLVALLRRTRAGLWTTVQSVIALANGVLFHVVVYHLLAPDAVSWRGPATWALAAVYVTAARATASTRGDSPGTRAAHYTGVGLAALAVPLTFDLAGVTMGWLVLGLALWWFGLRQANLPNRAMGLGVLLLGLFRVLTWDAVHTFDRAVGFRLIANGDFLAGAAAAVAVGLLAAAMARNRETLSALERRLVTPFILLAPSLLLWRISLESVAFFAAREDRLGASTELPSLLTLSLIWAIYSGILILAGFAFKFRPVRLLGMAILGILVLKVFLFDMQELERGYRIASFVAVGVLLLAISLLYQRERRAPG